MASFRFMSGQRIDAALQGKFRLNTLHYYRLLEVLHGDEWIGDIMEGVAPTRLDGIHLKGGGDQPELRKHLSDAGILKDPHGYIEDLRIDDSLFIDQVEGCILCFSEGDFETLQSTMCTGGYNSAIKIEGLAAFANHMYQYGQTKDGPLRDIVWPPEVGRVSYTNEVVDFKTQGRLKVSPFLKQKKYLDQAEVRIFFPLRNRSFDDPIDVECFPPDGMIAEVCRNVPTSPSNIKDRIKFEGDAVKELLIIIGEIDGFIPKLNEQPDLAWVVKDRYLRRALSAYWELRDETRYRNLEDVFVSIVWRKNSVWEFRTFLMEYIIKVRKYGIEERLRFFDDARGEGVADFF